MSDSNDTEERNEDRMVVVVVAVRKRGWLKETADSARKYWENKESMGSENFQDRRGVVLSNGKIPRPPLLATMLFLSGWIK